MNLEEKLEMAKAEEYEEMIGSGLAPHEIGVEQGIWLIWNKTYNTKVNIKVDPKHHVVVVTLESRPPIKTDLANFGRGNPEQAQKDRYRS